MNNFLPFSLFGDFGALYELVLFHFCDRKCLCSEHEKEIRILLSKIARNALGRSVGNISQWCPLLVVLVVVVAAAAAVVVVVEEDLSVCSAAAACENNNEVFLLLLLLPAADVGSVVTANESPGALSY